MAKPTTELSAQGRVILFCAATDIDTPRSAFSPMRCNPWPAGDFIAHNRESGSYTLTDSGRATLGAILENAGLKPRSGSSPQLELQVAIPKRPQTARSKRGNVPPSQWACSLREGHMAIQIRRRDFITLLGAAAAAWPLVALAQQARMPVIGFLSSLSVLVTNKRISAFGQGLSETGYTVGRDVTVEARMAEGQYDRLPALAADLVAGQVRLIAASGPLAAFAAKEATTSIPVVFVAAFDPVQAGLVASLNRPGGNVTGITFVGASLGGKRLELARELVPNVRVIALMTNPNSPDALEELRDVQNAAKAIGQELLVVPATSDSDFEAAFASIVQHRAGVLLISTDPFLFQSTDRLIALAARDRIPAVYNSGESVAGGGLISYGASISDAWRLAGAYAGRILRGARPAELPVVEPTKFELVINLKTARALGLDIPAAMLARADEVIE
jgi:putative ABC transport system substrate-binding protein